MKSVSFIQRNTQGHWVGDGFPVRTLFSYNDDPAAFSPFLMLDYGGPMNFEPTSQRRGVGAHPHRGFETVTIVYDGEVSHRDSSGGGGTFRDAFNTAGSVPPASPAQRARSSAGKASRRGSSKVS